MSLLEKGLILGSLGAIGGYSVYFVLKHRVGRVSTSSAEYFQRRLELLKNPKIKILYSTMTLLYLQGIERNETSGLYDLHELLDLSRPNFVALPISEKDFADRYKQIINTPRYPESMKKLEYFLKTKELDMKQLPDIAEDDIPYLFAYDFCLRKQCKILYADRNRDIYERELAARKQLTEIMSEDGTEVIGTVKNNLNPEEIETEVLYSRSCLLYTSPSPRDRQKSRMPSSA
eukprot:TRINITY_DN11605_c0_g1_i1.p1 TRINITY_DN11605_c0_g1~~TRINITY_DN11605_c0_g1_i1.p1  ORF type:complete len:232 (+),score=46.35 TRINITY_DN11605_c0_g1_i1:128-823(+)